MTETHHVAASAIERLSLTPPAIWIVSGLPGEHRHTITLNLLETFKQVVHIDGDALAEAITGGLVRPGEEPQEESERQVELTIRNQCLLARSYAEARFTPVVEYAVLTRSQLDAYRHYLVGGQVRLVVALATEDTSGPAELLRAELTGLGLWPRNADGAAIREAEAEASIS